MAKLTFEERFVAAKTAEELVALSAAIGKRLALELREPVEAGRFEVVPATHYLKDAQYFQQNWGKMQGLSTGYAGIDRLTLGLAAGELIVLGGYTSRGKSQLAINIAHRVASGGTSVLFVTLEMTKAQIVARLMQLGNLPDNLYLQAADALEAADVASVVERASAYGVGLVVIDHLHYFARGADLLGKVGEVTRDFKRLAVTQGVPVLLLSQLRRPVVSGGKRSTDVPGLGDLKESGYIEQDADIVLMVHRITAEDVPDQQFAHDFNEVTVAQRKNRNRGMVGEQKITLRHDQANGVRLFEESRISAVFPGAREVENYNAKGAKNG